MPICYGVGIVFFPLGLTGIAQSQSPIE